MHGHLVRSRVINEPGMRWCFYPENECSTKLFCITAFNRRYLISIKILLNPLLVQSYSALGGVPTAFDCAQRVRMRYPGSFTRHRVPGYLETSSSRGNQESDLKSFTDTGTFNKLYKPTMQYHVKTSLRGRLVLDASLSRTI